MKYIFISLVLAMALGGCQEQAVKKQPSAEQLVTESKYWDYAYGSHFADGGSIAYGFINQEGIPVYVVAYCPMQSPEKRKLSLKRSFNDVDGREIATGSKLEADVLKVVENASEYSVLEEWLPNLAALKAMLRDRTAPFPSDYSESQQDSDKDYLGHPFAPQKFKLERAAEDLQPAIPR